jgi:long-chain fatty acid transport protein
MATLGAGEQPRRRPNLDPDGKTCGAVALSRRPSHGAPSKEPDMHTHHALRWLPAVPPATLAALLAAGGAQAAGIERVIPSTTRILYEEGNYGELGLSYTDPHQSGDDAYLGFAGIDATVEGNTGDLFDDHSNFSASFKGVITPQLSYALLYDQPYGTATTYGNAPMTGAAPGLVFNYDGTTADLDTNQLTAVMAYDLPRNFKAFAGLRAQELDASAAIPFVGPTAGLPGYTVDAGSDWGYGWLIGAGWSRPDIAARVSLTYYSAVDHDLDTTEFGDTPLPPPLENDTQTDVSTPQSVQFEAQTGVAPRTLVFGSIRWVDWSEFDIAPPTYSSPLVVGAPLVDYDDDWWTYGLGVAHQITDALAGSLSLTYEPEVGGQLTTLGPYDGRTTVTAALSYDVQAFNVTGGVTYGRLGDTSNVLETDFDDGSVWGLGLRVGYSF